MTYANSSVLIMEIDNKPKSMPLSVTYFVFKESDNKTYSKVIIQIVISIKINFAFIFLFMMKPLLVQKLTQHLQPQYKIHQFLLHIYYTLVIKQLISELLYHFFYSVLLL